MHRREELRASKIMQDRAFANPKIDFRWNSVVEDVIGNGRLEGVLLRDIATDERSELAVNGHLRGDRPRSEHRAVRRVSSTSTKTATS